MDRILPPYPPDRSASAQRQLERLGVEVRTRTRVIDLDETRPGRAAADGSDEAIPPGPSLGGGRAQRWFARTVADATGGA